MRAAAWIRFAVAQICVLLATLTLSESSSDVPKPQSPAQTKAGAERNPRININRATIAELKTLPGVGEATAQRIFAYRSKNPPFRRVEELLIIRGISRNRLEQLRNRIRLD
jgi:competence protein ComEA